MLTSLDDESARVKIDDLGLAERVGGDEAQFAEQVAGTPDFMAPEVLAMYWGLHEGPYFTSPSTDVWSLGMTLFGLACGGEKTFTWSSLLGADKKKKFDDLLSDDGPVAVAIAQLPDG